MWPWCKGHDREDAGIVSIGADSWKRSESALTKIRRGASQASGSASRSSRSAMAPVQLGPAGPTSAKPYPHCLSCADAAVRASA